jgi:hypothetical protein
VVLAPRRWRQACKCDVGPLGPIRRVDCRRGWQESPVTRESSEETVKTIARGMPDCFGEPVVTNSCASNLSHARLRVHRAPGIPCALCFSEGNAFQKLGRETRRGNADSRPPLSCSASGGASSIPEAFACGLPSLEYWIARSSRAMTVGMVAAAQPSSTCPISSRGIFRRLPRPS